MNDITYIPATSGLVEGSWHDIILLASSQLSAAQQKKEQQTIVSRPREGYITGVLICSGAKAALDNSSLH